jgi:hypothetical protein
VIVIEVHGTDKCLILNVYLCGDSIAISIRDSHSTNFKTVCILETRNARINASRDECLRYTITIHRVYSVIKVLSEGPF